MGSHYRLYLYASLTSVKSPPKFWGCWSRSQVLRARNGQCRKTCATAVECLAGTNYRIASASHPLTRQPYTNHMDCSGVILHFAFLCTSSHLILSTAPFALAALHCNTAPNSPLQQLPMPHHQLAQCSHRYGQHVFPLAPGARHGDGCCLPSCPTSLAAWQHDKQPGRAPLRQLR